VAAALRVTGLDQAPHFTNYHRVLNRSRWSSRRVAQCLFRLLVSAFVPNGPVIIGLDGTLERRWGAKIAARGIYRDPTRSSHGHFVKASGLRWLSVMILPEIAWAGRVWALPFLTALAPSERYARSRQRRHKKLTDWGRQLLLQTARWLPDRQIIGVADSSYAAIDLLNAVRNRVCMITRLRLDARLFDPPARRRPGTIGRPRVIGTRQASLAERLTNPKTRWRRAKVTGWYGRGERTVEILSGTALWHHPGRLVPIRYVMVRDVAGELRPQAFLCTDLKTDPVDILRWFVRRWSIEVTFAEVRRHTSAWRPNGSGPIPRSRGQRRRCSACSRWSRCGRTSCVPASKWRVEPPPGIQSHSPPSATHLHLFAANSGRGRVSTSPQMDPDWSKCRDQPSTP